MLLKYNEAIKPPTSLDGGYNSGFQEVGISFASLKRADVRKFSKSENFLRMRHRKIVVLLVVSLIIAMVPCAVSAEDEALTEVISSAEEVVETILPTSITGGAVGMTVDAKSAVLIDAASGTVLFEQNSHDRLPPASVTKVMTMLLIMEAIDRGQMTLEDKVTISEKAASMGGSQMYMEPGEQQKLETLMLGIAVASANDACVAAAEYHSGTADIFVENMNKRAAELGMVDTNFVNTNGLPVANHYTSAYDIALMSKELLKHDKIQDWFSIWMTNITVGLPGKKQTELGLTNTNRMIKNYPGANGIKTGFTQDAGYCLSASAKKGDLELISVIMGSTTSKIRFAEASKLLDYGFANYDSVKLAEKGEPMGMVVIEKGSPNLVNAVAPENISILVKKGEKETIKGELVFKDIISAPITKGDQLGELVIYKKDTEIARYPIVAEENVKKGQFDADLYEDNKDLGLIGGIVENE